MQESFLHYIWQMQYFQKGGLHTKEGEHVEIFEPGVLNTNAGPDFSNARVKIGLIDWVGSVEVHVHSSEWFDHHHETDDAYDNVILHVVWRHDKPVARKDQTLLPTLELRARVDPLLVRQYRQLIGSAFQIPCQNSLASVSEFVKHSMLEKSLVERLERKAAEVQTILCQNGNDWEETFYQLLARNFGFKINAEPFYQLARWLPLKVLLKQADKQEQLEALLFGQAGFLDAAKGDSYYLRLRREHQLLGQKYSILPKKMTKARWRFLRLRPANFPSLRLAQLGAILHHQSHLFSRVLACENLNALRSLFVVDPSEYWLDHYQFSRQSKGKVHELGRASIDNVLINTVAPVWVAYGKQSDDQRFIDRAMDILQQLPAEENKILQTWKNLGLTARSAFESQALVELFNNFCQVKNCLHCNIGTSLLCPRKG